MVPAAARDLYFLNPIAGLLTLYHDVLYWGRMPSPELLGGMLLAAVTIFLADMLSSVATPRSSPRSSEPAVPAVVLRGNSKRFDFYEHRTSSLREWFIRRVLRRPIHVGRAAFTLHDLDLTRSAAGKRSRCWAATAAARARSSA